MGVLDLVEVDLTPDKQLQLGCKLGCGVLVRHPPNPRCSSITSYPLLLCCPTALVIDTGSEGRAARRTTMAKKGQLIPPSVPTNLKVLSMPKDNCKEAPEEDDSGAESESEWESEESEEEEGEEEGQSSDSGLGSQGSGHCPRQRVQDCKQRSAGREFDRGPYDPTPLACFTTLELEVGQRCRDWVTKITDPASRVSFIFILSKGESKSESVLKGLSTTVRFLGSIK